VDAKVESIFNTSRLPGRLLEKWLGRRHITATTPTRLSVSAAGRALVRQPAPVAPTLINSRWRPGRVYDWYVVLFADKRRRLRQLYFVVMIDGRSMCTSNGGSRWATHCTRKTSYRSRRYSLYLLRRCDHMVGLLLSWGTLTLDALTKTRICIARRLSDWRFLILQKAMTDIG